MNEKNDSGSRALGSKIDSGSRALGSKWKSTLGRELWPLNGKSTLGRELWALNGKSTLGRELWALNGKERTNSKVDRKQMDQSRVIEMLRARLVSLGKKICPSIQGARSAETTNKSIIR